MITLTQLEYIVAVEKHGNFSAAAKSCFVTQPTLSMQIQKLEDHLGVILFDRSKQPVQPTAIGKKIIDQSRIVLAQSSMIDQLINEEKHEVAGELHLAIIPTLAPYLLPLFLNEFSIQFPKVKLSIEESKTDDIIAALEQNQLDVGLVVTPLHEAKLREHVLFQEPFYVYASKDSDLASKRTVTENDLKDQELLLLTEGNCMREQMLEVCSQRNMERHRTMSRIQFESGSIETLCHLVERGHGYTVIPHLAKTWKEYNTGQVIPFAAPIPSREVSLVTHKSFARDSLLKALARTIKACLPAELVELNNKGLSVVKVRP